MRKQFRRNDRAVKRTQAQIEKQLIDNYSKSQTEISNKVANFWSKHADNYENAQKYNRLTNLERDISKEMGKLTGKNSSHLKSGLRAQYRESFYRTAFTLESEVQAKLGYGQISKEQIRRAVENPLDRVGFLKRNRDNQARLTRQLNEKITQGIIQGKSYQDVARDINDRFDVGRSNAKRIAQTESHRAQQQGKLDSFKQAESKGVNMVKVWVATLDDSTRDDHGEMDGQKKKIDEPFVSPDGDEGDQPGGFGVQDMDINCRCSMRVEIEGYEPEVRRSRKDGVIPYTNYEDWEKDRIG